MAAASSTTSAAAAPATYSKRRRGIAPRRSTEDAAISPHKCAKPGSRRTECTRPQGAASPLAAAGASGLRRFAGGVRLTGRAIGRAGARVRGGAVGVLFFACAAVLVHNDLRQLFHGGLRGRLVQHDRAVLDHA